MESKEVATKAKEEGIKKEKDDAAPLDLLKEIEELRKQIQTIQTAQASIRSNQIVSASTRREDTVIPIVDAEVETVNPYEHLTEKEVLDIYKKERQERRETLLQIGQSSDIYKKSEVSEETEKMAGELFFMKSMEKYPHLLEFKKERYDQFVNCQYKEILNEKVNTSLSFDKILKKYLRPGNDPDAADLRDYSLEILLHSINSTTI